MPSLFRPPCGLHEGDGICHVAGKAEFMGDDDHRHSGGGEIPHHVEDFRHQFRIERRRRLVEENEIRPHAHGAGDRNALLLAAGKFGWIVVRLVRKPHPLQQRRGSGARFLHRLAEHVHRTLDDVFQGGLVREKVEALKDHADPPPLARNLRIADLVEIVALAPVADQLVVDPDPSAVHPLQQVDAAQKRALPRTGGTDDAAHFSAGDLQAHLVERAESAVVLCDVDCFDENILVHDRPHMDERIDFEPRPK